LLTRLRKKIDLSDIPETGFAQPNAVRGKHHARFFAATGLVQLAPDVRRAFADDDAVNRALRHVLELAKGRAPVNPVSRADRCGAGRLSRGIQARE
jgi:hypothetical protein